MRQRPEFFRFRDLDPVRVNVEYQMHTDQTDGEAPIAGLLRAASDRALSAVAFTEHVREDTPWFGEFAARVRAAAEGYPGLRVFVGCEAKALDHDGGLDASPAILSECDVVLGSVHRFPDGRGGLLRFEDLSAERTAELECSLAVGLLRHAPIDVLAHPGGMYERRHGALPERYFRRILEASLEREVAVEINASYLRDFDGFLRLCEEINPRVSIGSDVHRIEEMGRCRDRLRNSRWIRT